jgi:hypothetical protein
MFGWSRYSVWALWVNIEGLGRQAKIIGYRCRGVRLGIGVVFPSIAYDRCYLFFVSPDT